MIYITCDDLRSKLYDLIDGTYGRANIDMDLFQLPLVLEIGGVTDNNNIDMITSSA